MKEEHKGSWLWLLSDLMYSIGHFLPAVSGPHTHLAVWATVASAGLFFSINWQENLDISFRQRCQH